MSLIEMVVGLAVASVVGAIAATGLSMTGLAVMRQRAATVDDDAAWLALTAIANDLRASSHWKLCIEARGCSLQSAHAGMSVLVLAEAEWLVDGALLRCKIGKPCDTYLEGITGIEFLVDSRTPDGGIARRYFIKRDGATPHALRVTLSTRDGRRYSRTTGVNESAPSEGTTHAP